MQSVADFPWRWAHVTATLLVKTGGGALHTITLNILDAGMTVTVYDGVDAGGAVIGIIGTALSQPITLIYDAEVQTGIYIAIAGQGTADLTVNYI